MILRHPPSIIYSQADLFGLFGYFSLSANSSYAWWTSLLVVRRSHDPSGYPQGGMPWLHHHHQQQQQQQQHLHRIWLSKTPFLSFIPWGVDFAYSQKEIREVVSFSSFLGGGGGCEFLRLLNKCYISSAFRFIFRVQLFCWITLWYNILHYYQTMLTFVRWMVSCRGRIFLGPCFPKRIFWRVFSLGPCQHFSTRTLWWHHHIKTIIWWKSKGWTCQDGSPSLDISAFVKIPKILWYVMYEIKKFTSTSVDNLRFYLIWKKLNPRTPAFLHT